MERVSAIVFLATPHKGSSLVRTSNSILKSTPGYSINSYSLELETGSTTLQDINEQFRNVCAGLELVSFNEAMKTSLMPGFKKMVGNGVRPCIALALRFEINNDFCISADRREGFCDSWISRRNFNLSTGRSPWSCQV